MSDMYITPDASQDSNAKEADITHKDADTHMKMFPIRHCKVLIYTHMGSPCIVA